MIVNTSKIKLPSPIPRRLKWGVAGCGNYTVEYFLPALQFVQRSKIVSLFCNNLNRAKDIASKFSTANTFDDYDLFLNSDIDSVYISGVNTNHYELVNKAAIAKKNILCELPISVTLEQAEKMIQVCNENKVHLIVNFLHRFHPQVQKVRELLEKQIVGKIVSISASYHSDFPQANIFRTKKELSSGALHDLGAQMIDLLHYFGGEIVETKTFIDNVVYKSEMEDFASALVKFKNGGYGNFSVSYDCKKLNNRIEVVGQYGSIIIENFFGKKNAVSKLIIDLNGEGRKVFRKRMNNFAVMLRSVQKSFIKNELAHLSTEDFLADFKIIDEIIKQKNK
ncbi:MAG: oxidoreductase [Ignavibacteria bacterium]|nr:MAG: oxidoreductase [Ignavibacteria bacterium]KAF0159871.1 MAG: oxidoreductase [Ignavibacteria bacterium]